MNGTIPNCTPNGKYMTNGFLFDLLKLNIGVTYSKSVHVRGVVVGGIDCNDFVGLKNKKPRFRASSEFVCTVFNYILQNSTLDWTGLDSSECLLVDKNFRKNTKKMHDDIQAVMWNKRISKDEKAKFLDSNFDPGRYENFSQIVKKAKIEDGTHVDSQDRMLDNCSKSLTTDVIIEGCQSEIVTRSKNAVDSTICAKSCEVRVEIGVKRKRSLKPKPRCKTPSIAYKIPIWRSTYKSKLNQIKNLKKEVSDLKLQVSKANADLVDSVRVENKYTQEIASLRETVDEYELELEKREEVISNWKQKYQNLKDDYESEAFKHSEEVSILREELDSKETSESVEQLGNLFDAEEVPQIKIRAGLKNINPHVLKILCILRIVVGLSLRKFVTCLVLVGNNMFGQNWSLPESKEYIFIVMLMCFLL
jgi:hypothetical protein